jgi:hypothetical protein
VPSAKTPRMIDCRHCFEIHPETLECTCLDLSCCGPSH